VEAYLGPASTFLVIDARLQGGQRLHGSLRCLQCAAQFPSNLTCCKAHNSKAQLSAHNSKHNSKHNCLRTTASTTASTTVCLAAAQDSQLHAAAGMGGAREATEVHAAPCHASLLPCMIASMHGPSQISVHALMHGSIIHSSRKFSDNNSDSAYHPPKIMHNDYMVDVLMQAIMRMDTLM